MAQDRITEAWKSWKNSQIKFDYYVLGIAAALLAYLSSNLKTEPEALYQTWFEVTAASFVLTALICGFFRLLDDLSLQSINFQKLVKSDDINKCKEKLKEPLEPNSRQKIEEFIEDTYEDIAAATKELEKRGKRFEWLFEIRNYSILIAFSIIVFSKLYAAINQTWNFCQ